LETVARERTPSTVQIHLSAIDYHHYLAHHAKFAKSPEISELMKGIRRRHKQKPVKKSALALDDLRHISSNLPDTLVGKRDRAILLVGWTGAFRRSELAKLTLQDLHWTKEGLSIMLPYSKTDQEGKGLTKYIVSAPDEAIDPVRALKRWLEASGIKGGPIFRSVWQNGKLGKKAINDKFIAGVVKQAVESIGLDPRTYAGHSLRSGFITEAAMLGAPSRSIMAQTGHKSEAVMRGYIQDEGLEARRLVKAMLRAKDEAEM
jgi:integrase